MLTQSTPPDLDSILNEDNDGQLPGETIRYLSNIENKLYADIQARKRIDSGLLFLACQFSSCSLSWLLFQLQITLSIIQLASFCISCLPGLIDMGDSFNFSISSESWEFSLGQKPLIGIIKLLIGGTVILLLIGVKNYTRNSSQMDTILVAMTQKLNIRTRHY